MKCDEYQSQQRAALVAWWLAHGEGLRTTDVAQMTGLSRQGAYKLMMVLSEKLPIYRTGKGIWEICETRELMSTAS